MLEAIFGSKLAIPKASKTDRATDLPNWADNHETVKKFLERAKQYWSDFDGQTARKEMLDRIELADQYYRYSDGQTKQDKDKTPDLEDLRSHLFTTAVDVISANENDILFPRTSDSGTYRPLGFLPAATRTSVDTIVEKRNLILEYSRVADNRIPKLQRTIWAMQKYGTAFVEMEWISKKKTVRRRVQNVLERMFTDWRSAWKEITTDEERSQLVVHDIKDVWVDSMIDDDTNPESSLAGQSCIIIRCRPTFQDLVAGQGDGAYKNVNFLSTEQSYRGESPDTAMEKRLTNAGEGGDASQPDGRMETWRIVMMAPINDKGEWDEDKTVPRRFRMTVAGNLALNGPNAEPPSKENRGGLIALQLNPYPYNSLMITACHSHKDDKGVYHKGYIDNAKWLLEEHKTSLNQWFYAKDVQMAAPIITEQGAIYTKDKSFGPSKIIEMAVGMFDRIQKLEYPVQTNDMLAVIQYTEDTFYNDVVLMPDAFRGKAMGARTSSREAGNALSQSSKPFMDKVRYEGDQVVRWEAEKNDELFQQFAPKNLMVALSGSTTPEEIAPEDYEGPMMYKIVAVDNYERDVLEKANRDRFNSVILPLMVQAQAITPQGMAEWGKFEGAKNGWPIDKMWPNQAPAQPQPAEAMGMPEEQMGAEAGATPMAQMPMPTEQPVTTSDLAEQVLGGQGGGETV